MAGTNTNDGGGKMKARRIVITVEVESIVSLKETKMLVSYAIGCIPDGIKIIQVQANVIQEKKNA